MDAIKQFNLLLIVLVVIALASLFVATRDQEIVLSQSESRNTISITGEAERFVAPDTASMSFSMTRKSTNLSEATDSVNERISSLVSSLRSDGVRESDIKTTNYSVQPQYIYNERERVFDGYRVTQSLEVKIRDLDSVSSVVSKIGELEVDNVSGLSFFVDNDEEIREELREEAIDDARAQASRLASDLGVSLSKIIGFSEGGAVKFISEPVFRTTAFAEEALFDASVPVSIPTGEDRLNARVTITYELE